MKYSVSKTKKNVTVTRRGGGRKKQSLPTQAAPMALEFPEPQLEAICDNPGMLRLGHMPIQMDVSKQLSARA